jgi:hypothetical protein
MKIDKKMKRNSGLTLFTCIDLESLWLKSPTPALVVALEV